MRTLAEFNQEREDAYKRQLDPMKPHPNNIECPRCTSELWDSCPTIILTSNPPQKDIHCPKCGWRGYRLA